LTEYELTSLALDLFRDMDSQIRFWLEATFAVLVAVFFAGTRLTRGMRRLVASLYLAASLLAGLRWVLTLRRNLAYRELLIDGGHADIPTDVWLLVPVNLLIAFIFFAGVAGALHFLRTPAGDAIG